MLFSALSELATLVSTGDLLLLVVDLVQALLGELDLAASRCGELVSGTRVKLKHTQDCR